MKLVAISATIIFALIGAFAVVNASSSKAMAEDSNAVDVTAVDITINNPTSTGGASASLDRSVYVVDDELIVNWKGGTSGSDFVLPTSIKYGNITKNATELISVDQMQEQNSEYLRRMSSDGNMTTYDSLSAYASQTHSVSLGKVSALNTTVEITWQVVTPVYRLYNMITSEHLFTTQKTEYDNFVSVGRTNQDYWIGEGISWLAPTTGTKVERYYNAGLGAQGHSSHYYSSDATEIANLKAAGWTYDSGCDLISGGTTPIYTCYNEALGSAHHYTSSKSEWQNLSANGWQLEEDKNGVNPAKSPEGVFQGVVATSWNYSGNYYKVNHVLEGATSAFATQWLSGTAGQTTAAQALSVPGYEGTASTATISANNSTVVSVNYTKANYQLKLNYNQADQESKSVSVKYAAAMTPETPSANGQVFKGWYYDSKFTKPFVAGSAMPASDVRLFAQWEDENAGGGETGGGETPDPGTGGGESGGETGGDTPTGKTYKVTFLYKDSIRVTSGEVQDVVEGGVAVAPTFETTDGREVDLTKTSYYPTDQAGNLTAESLLGIITDLNKYPITKDTYLLIAPTLKQTTQGGESGGETGGETTTKEALDFSKFTVNTEDRVYNGSQIAPEVTSTYSNGDYAVAYGQNRNVGKGTITITGAGNYTGTKVYSFNITKKTAIVYNITVNDKYANGSVEANLNYNNIEIPQKCEGDQLSATATGTYDSEFAGNDKTVTISNIQLTGADAGNYELDLANCQSSAKGNILESTYTIVFHQNDGAISGTMENQTRKVGDGGSLPALGFTKDRYGFKYWTTQANGGGTQFSNKYTGDITTESGVTVDLYAQWTTVDVGSFWFAKAKTITKSATEVVANSEYQSPEEGVVLTQYEVLDGIQQAMSQRARGINQNSPALINGTEVNYYKLFYDWMISDEYHLYVRLDDTNMGYETENDYLEFRIVQVGQHDSDGTILTFQATHILKDLYKMRDDGGNNYSFYATNLGRVLNSGGIYSQFDSSLSTMSKHIAHLHKPYQNGTKETNYSDARMWIMSSSELSDVSSTTGNFTQLKNEGSQYAFWKDRGLNYYGEWSAITELGKKRDGSGTTSAMMSHHKNGFWLRSAWKGGHWNTGEYIGQSTYFGTAHTVDGKGYVNAGADGGDTRGVVLCFAIDDATL